MRSDSTEKPSYSPNFSSNNLAVSATAPFTTAYASESRYFGTSSAKRAATLGVCSEGLRMTGQPAAMAPTSGPKERM